MNNCIGISFVSKMCDVASSIDVFGIFIRQFISFIFNNFIIFRYCCLTHESLSLFFLFQSQFQVRNGARLHRKIVVHTLKRPNVFVLFT